MKAAISYASFSLVIVTCAFAEDARSVRTVIEGYHANAARWYAAGDAESIVSIFSEGAWMLPGGSAPLVGREAIRTHLRQAFRWGKWDVSLHLEALDVAGAVAVERGSYVIRFAAGPDAPPAMRSFQDRGNFLVHWRREADGKWRILADAPISQGPPQSLTESGAR